MYLHYSCLAPTHQGQGKYGRFAPWVREKGIIFAEKGQGKSGNFFLKNAYEPCGKTGLFW